MTTRRVNCSATFKVAAAQWTIVVTGSCTFTANGETKVYNAGETYFIPAGLRHQITLHAGYSEVDYVDDPND